MVGNANGTSMTRSSSRRPQNRSRTSTQASAVPITTLTAVTASASSTVSVIAAPVWELVTTDQNPDQPPEAAATTTAASGIRTSRLNQIIEAPSANPDPAARRPGTRARRRRVTPGADAATDATSRLLGVGEQLGDQAVGVVEELRVGVVPTAEVLVDAQ